VGISFDGLGTDVDHVVVFGECHFVTYVCGGDRVRPIGCLEGDCAERTGIFGGAEHILDPLPVAVVFGNEKVKVADFGCDGGFGLLIVELDDRGLGWAAVGVGGVADFKPEA
jgi:hypothetical protein